MSTTTSASKRGRSDSDDASNELHACARSSMSTNSQSIFVRSPFLISLVCQWLESPKFGSSTQSRVQTIDKTINQSKDAELLIWSRVSRDIHHEVITNAACWNIQCWRVSLVEDRRLMFDEESFTNSNQLRVERFTLRKQRILKSILGHSVWTNEIKPRMRYLSIDEETGDSVYSSINQSVDESISQSMLESMLEDSGYDLFGNYSFRLWPRCALQFLTSLQVEFDLDSQYESGSSLHRLIDPETLPSLTHLHIIQGCHTSRQR